MSLEPTLGDARLRSPLGIEEPPADGVRPRWPSVGELAEAEPLLPLPVVSYPATVEAEAQVDHRATVAFRGNRYSVVPGMQGATVGLRHRLGTNALEIYSRLANLHLAAAAEALRGLLDQAKAERWSPTALLERLFVLEVAASAARRRATLARFACLPAPWRISDFDFEAQPSVDRKLVLEPPGGGKLRHQPGSAAHGD